MSPNIDGDPYPVKALFVQSTNPVMSDPDRDKVLEMFKHLDLAVACEVLMSETALECDIVLPETSFYEMAEMVVTLPFIFPVVLELDIDPIWFGIVLVKLIEISVVTPPVGINLFAVLGVLGGQADFRDVCVGVIPFILLDLIVLALLIFFPILATWLPTQMIG